MLGRTEHRGVCRLLSSVMSGTEPHTDRQEDYRFLQSMLMEKKLHLLFKIHERLRRFEKRSPLPAQEQAAALAPDLLESLAHQGRQTEFKELLLLLSKPHFKSLLTVHDAVAQKDFEPTLPPMPDIVLDEDESLVKIVSLVKTKEPLGATIKRDESTGAIVVARIMRGGAAHKSGLIHEGDELREVNGVSLERKKPKEVLPLLARSRGEVTFTVVPASTEEEPPTDKKLYVRTLFGYEPGTDPAVPCREAALRFGRGDVLRILSKEDDAWWQARRCGDGENRAGLIPSPQLQERRVALRRPSALFEPWRVRTHLGETAVAAMREGTEEKLSALCGGRVGEFSDTEQDADYGALTGIHIASLRRSFRLGRKGGRARDAPARRRSCGVESLTQTPTYMEVVPYRRTPEDRGRLVVLVGPGGVGVSELKRRLLLFDTDRFGLPVPHTSREKRTAERDGVHYNFTSRRGFEEDILNHRLIEYGSYRGHYYGTSVDSVHQVMAEGKVCILDVQPNAIRSLYTCEFKPYVVFVKPPPVEELRLTRRKAKMICDEEDRKTTRMFSEADFEEMMDSAEATEIQFGHLFDRTVVNGDLAAASGELRAVLQEMAGPQVQWLPAAWTRPKPKSTQSLP